jgi:DNA-binding MarR family transcriptional regulator
MVASAPLTDDEELVWRNLLRLACGLPRALAEEIQLASGVRWAEFSVLMHLSQSHDLQLGMSELADRAGLSPSRVSRVVDELATDGLVERRLCPEDRRCIVATLTEAGSVTLLGAWPHYLRIARLLALDHLTAAETQALGLILVRLVKALGAETEAAHGRLPKHGARDFPGGS